MIQKANTLADNYVDMKPITGVLQLLFEQGNEQV